MKYWLSVILVMLLGFMANAQVKRSKNITYQAGSSNPSQTLDVYYPKIKNQEDSYPVFLFVHGGSWQNSQKNVYSFLGRHLAQRGVVAVIINYRLSPEVTIEPMIYDVEKALEWISGNISNYGGNPESIAISGHSAGGHLAAMTTLGKDSALIDKCVLIDAFGLDMVTYFGNYDTEYSRGLKKIFSEDTANWRRNSPLYLVNRQTKTPFLILIGGRTYPSIKSGSKDFADKLSENGVYVEIHDLPKRKHIPMISQFFWKKNATYDTIMKFLEDNSL